MYVCSLHTIGRKANALTIIRIKCRYVIYKVRFFNNCKTQIELYSPAQNQFDPELWYKVLFFTVSCRLDIVIKDSGW